MLLKNIFILPDLVKNETYLAANANSNNDEWIIYKDKTVMDFEGDDIDGKMKRPGALFINARKKEVFKSLIRLKKVFNQRVEESAQEVQSYPYP